jgi:hypothetical protein
MAYEDDDVQPETGGDSSDDSGNTQAPPAAPDNGPDLSGMVNDDEDSGPPAPGGVVGALDGASAPPPPALGGGQAPAPGYAGKIDGRTGQAIPPDPRRPWQAILKGALDGIANAGNAKNFAEGFSAGAAGELKQQQVDKANKRADDQLAMQEQHSMDEHQVAQAQLAMSHIQQQNLVREYNLAPKSTQDILDQISMKAGQDAKNTAGSNVIGTFDTYAQAQARATVEMKAKTESPFSVQVYHNAQGGFDVIDVPNANKLNETPQDVVIGYDFNSKKPVTRTFAPGTITYAQKTQMETNAATKIADASNAMEEFKAKSAFEQSTPQAQAELAHTQAETAKLKQDVANSTPGTVSDAFGVKVGITPEGQALTNKEYISRTDKFSKDYVQPLNKLAKTNMEFDRINNDPNQTGAEKVTALLAAVGISGDALKGQGFRISTDVINEHAEARNAYQTFVQKWNKVAGSGGPITAKQISDYTDIARGVVHDAYVNAAQEARRQGVAVNFLPRPTTQGQVVDKATAQIYLDAASGNVESAHNALTAAGYK